jgi:methylase of polypeptide subunit release factors
VHVRRLPAREPFAGLVKLFLLGLTLERARAEAALGADGLEVFERSGWLESSGASVRAAVKLVPHGDLLVASDRDADGPTGFDWVAGIHPPSVTLAKLTVRRRVERALDVATGNGVQALLASRHADAVVATDVNARALAFAALNARLNGVANVELLQGSYFEPVQGATFDLIICNPPYVISPENRFAYRDSGLAGDTVSRHVVQTAAAFLRDGGFAHVLVSWSHPPDDWSSVLEGWVRGRGCDAWLLSFGSDDPLTHAAEWLRPVARDEPHAFADALDRWLAYLERQGIASIAHGAVILRRRTGGANWTRSDRVPLERLDVAGEHILRVFAAEDYLRGLDDERRLLEEPLAVAERHRLEQTLVCRGGEAQVEASVLALEEGLGFRTALDLHTARLVPLLDGRRPLGAVVAQRAAELGLPAEEARAYETAALPAVRRLLELGLLVRGRR